MTVLDGHDDELAGWVRTGIVDVAVLAGEHDGLDLQPLATDELLAVVPATHPLAARAAVRPRDLAGEPFILTRGGCERLVLAALGAHGVAPNVSHEVSEASSILAMVGEGLGVSVMPGLAAPARRRTWPCARSRRVPSGASRSPSRRAERRRPPCERSSSRRLTRATLSRP